MKNLKFVYKCILALLPILAVMVFTALVPFGYMDSEYPAWKYTKDVASGRADVAGASTLILGDSRAMADLIPELMGDDVVNLAVGGATSIEMYYTLENYIESNGCPDNVIIMFAPFHYTIIDNFTTRTAYFNYLSVNELRDLYSYAEAAGSETLMAKGWQNDLLSYRLRFPDKYLPALLNARLVSRYADNNAEFERLISDKGYGEFGTADGCSDLNYETSYEKMHTSGDAVLLDMYLNRLLTLCADNGIDTTLTMPPMNEASFNELNPSYVSEFSDYMDSIAIKYPAINVDGEFISMDDSYFGDSSHLNRRGAEIFTEDFISQNINKSE